MAKGWSEFGQHVTLTARIREILDNYPEGTSVLKELIQVPLPPKAHTTRTRPLERSSHKDEATLLIAFSCDLCRMRTMRVPARSASAWMCGSTAPASWPFRAWHPTRCAKAHGGRLYTRTAVLLAGDAVRSCGTKLGWEPVYSASASLSIE